MAKVKRRRPTGTGSLYQPTYRGPDKKIRHSKTWWIRFYDREGRSYESAKTEDKQEAEDVLRNRLLERDAGATRSRKVTLEHLGKMLLDDYKANGRKSVGSAEQRLTHLYAWFGEGEAAREITEDRITGYIAQRLEKGAKPATVNRELAALRRMFRLAARAGKLHRRPDFSMLAENNVRKGFVEASQLAGILAHLAEDLRAPVETAFLTGWRIRSEVLTRQWRHVDLEEGWLRLEPGETKNREGRMFPLTGRLLKLLKEQRRLTTILEGTQGRVIPWVFHREGHPIKTLLEAWRKACTKAGLPGRFLHDLRRSAVRNLERAAVPRSTAMSMVGHKTESIYRRYAIVDEAMLKEAGEKLAKLRRG